MSGVDLTVLEAIDPNTALVLMSEIGPDVSRFPTVKHFCSWLGLAPQHQMSAGKIRKRRVQGGASRAGRALRLAGQALDTAVRAAVPVLGRDPTRPRFRLRRSVGAATAHAT